MNRRVKCLPIPVEFSEKLQNAIEHYRRLVNERRMLGELRDAHQFLAGALSEMIDERNRAINGAIPDEVFRVDSIQNLSVTVELDPKIEKLIDEALELSGEYVRRLTGLR